MKYEKYNIENEAIEGYCREGDSVDAGSCLRVSQQMGLLGF